MNNKGFISTNQFIWMLYSVITSFTALEIPGMLIFHAGRESWLSVAGAWLLDVLLAIVFAYLGLRYKGQSMVQYSITILGKFFGSIVGLIFSFFFLISGALLMRSLTTAINRLFLIKTPSEVLLAVSYLLIAYAVKKGIETIARTCEFLGPIYLLSMLFFLAALLPKVKLHRLKPMFNHGFRPALTGIPFILSFIAICVIMGMYISICNHPEHGFWAKFVAVSMGASVIGIVLFLAIGIFGAEQAGNMVNPSFQLARLVRIGSFIERMEIVLLIIAIAAGVLTAANLIWAFSLGISQITGLSTYKPLVYPAVLLAYILNITSFNSNIESFNFVFYSFFVFGIFVEAGLEMLLFFVALFRKRDDRQKAE